MKPGHTVFEQVLQPVSGKAVPVLRGQTLRLSQVEGGQCVDFNAFNLHNYKEHLSVGHSRFAGFHLVRGKTLVSVPPRIRPMLHLLEMPATSVGDTLGPRCNAALFERRLGFAHHTNCQDTLAETIREYGLTPEDVHDSFNMFGNTYWSEGGRYWWEWSTARPEDAIEMLACMDLLCVPVTCGSGDVTPVSNFFLKSIKVEVLERSAESESLVEQINHEYAAPETHRRLDAEGYMPIRTERELTPDPGYRPNFKSPLATVEVAVDVSAAAARLVDHVASRDGVVDREDAVRRLVMSWCINELSTGVAGDSSGAAIAQRALHSLIS